LLEPEDCARPEIAQALADIRAGTTKVIGPFLTAGFAHRLLISPVTVRGDESGWIVLKEQGSRLSAFDAQVARRAATIIALELSARRRAAELHGSSAETLLRDLISGHGDPDSLGRRARFHSVNLDHARVMCLFCDGRGQPLRAQTSEAVSRSVSASYAPLIVATREGIALMLEVDQLAVSDPVSSAHAVARSILSSVPGGGTCIAGLSSVFTGVAGFAAAYREAQQVTRCLRTFAGNRKSRILAASELGSGRVFLASTSREEADEFVRETLGPLTDLADRSMCDLLSTLAVFLATSRSVRATAERVGVHENTIRYRLARIAELSGLDVATNVDHQLAGQLAILVLGLEGALPRAASPALDPLAGAELNGAHEDAKVDADLAPT
jgi:sugar diacid utilization regulator